MAIDWGGFHLPPEFRQTSSDEYHGPCPSCGGKDRCWVQPDRQRGPFCRQCSSDGSGKLAGDTYKRVAEAFGILKDAPIPKQREKPLDRWTFTTADGRRRAQFRWRCDCGSRADCEKCYGKGSYKRWAKPRKGGPESGELLYIAGGNVQADDGEPIYLTEGGSSADALAGLKVPTIGRAPGKPAQASLERLPVGPRYVVVPDHDASGYRQAVVFGQALAGLGRAVAALDPLKLRPDAPAKWDIRDWVEGGGKVEALASAVVELEAVEARAGSADRQEPTSAEPKGEGFDAGTEAILGELVGVKLGEVAGVLQRLRQQCVDRMLKGPAVGLVRAAAVERLRKRKIAGAREIVEGVVTLPGEAASEGNGGAGSAITWPEVKAAEAPQRTADLLAEVERQLERFVVWPEGGALTAAAWAMWTWVADHSQILPLLSLTSPSPECGKSTAVRAIGRFVPRPYEVEHASLAFIFRLIDAERPVLLLDEVDRWLKGEQGEERIAILDAGWMRGGKVGRVVGEDHEPRGFAVDSPKVLSGIRSLPDTLAGRSVVITLDRKAPGNRLERFRAAVHPAPELPGCLLRWAEDHGAEFSNLDPDMGELGNRPADNWAPLYAIADMAGGDYPARIRAAAGTLTGRAAERVPAERYSEMLLADVREVFAARGEPESMLSRDLDQALRELEDRPWATYGRSGKGLSSQMRGRWLASFGVQSRTLHGLVEDGAHAKGYARADLVPAWDRYLGGDPNRANRAEPMNTGDLNRAEGIADVNGSHGSIFNENGGSHGSHGSTGGVSGDPANPAANGAPANGSAQPESVAPTSASGPAGDPYREPQDDDDDWTDPPDDDNPPSPPAFDAAAAVAQIGRWLRQEESTPWWNTVSPQALVDQGRLRPDDEDVIAAAVDAADSPTGARLFQQLRAAMGLGTDLMAWPLAAADLMALEGGYRG